MIKKYTDEDFEFLADQVRQLKQRLDKLEGKDIEEAQAYTKPPLQKIQDSKE